MAHPKLSKLVGRSVLTVSTAALLAGPFAGMASAQVDLTTEIEKILVDGEYVEAILVDGVYVDPVSLEPIEGANETVGETGGTITDTVDKTAETVTKPREEASEGGSNPTPLPDLTDPEDTTTPNVGPGKQSGAGNTPTPIDEGSSSTSGGTTSSESTSGATTRKNTGTTTSVPSPSRHYMAGSGSVNFNPGASPWSGFSTMSSLTLQPFEEPIAAPGAAGLPGAAADLFLPEAAGPAGTAMTPASSGASSTSAPPTWLLATSTGLLMLVGAGHFVRMTTRNLHPAE